MSTTTHLPQAHVRRRFNPWLVVVGLAAALLALGAWVAIDRATGNEPENLASSEVVAMVKAMNGAYEANDANVAAAFYAKDAIMEETDVNGPKAHLVTTGRGQILMRWQEGVDWFQQSGWRPDVGSGVIQTGRLVASTQTFGVPGEEPNGEAVVVAELDESGKIVHEWAIVRWLRWP